VKSPEIQHIFEHSQLRTLDLGFIEDICDDVFMLLPQCRGGGGGGSGTGGGFAVGEDSKMTEMLRGVPSPAAGRLGLGGRKRWESPLQKLNLCKSKITDAGIFRMAYLAALVEIRLQWCTGITDAGVASLVRNCPKLRLLDLKSCPVTDAALQSIAALCRDLRVLNLSWCPGFSEQSLLELLLASSSTAGQQRRTGSNGSFASGSASSFGADRDGGYVHGQGGGGGDDGSNYTISYNFSNNGVGNANGYGGMDGYADMNGYVDMNGYGYGYGYGYGDRGGAMHPHGDGDGHGCVLEELSLEWCSQVTDRIVHALQSVRSLRLLRVTGCGQVTKAGVQALQRMGKVIEL
jgi:hypothetical protein